MPDNRPFLDSIELRAPGVAAIAVRALLRMPSPVRRRVLVDAFTRAADAFNRGDFEAIVGPWAEDVEYVPPPALHVGPPIVGRDQVLRFWQTVADRYDRSVITNLSLEEAGPSRFIRTARLRHELGGAPPLEYEIRQTTELRHGRVVRQRNDEL
jgi:ketosteroid isomerase-like protein